LVRLANEFSHQNAKYAGNAVENLNKKQNVKLRTYLTLF
jgi:hypothetical protein